MSQSMVFTIDSDGKVEFIEGKKGAIREFKGKSLMDFPNSYVVVDIETTGLDPKYDSIIEIGAIKYVDGEEKETFSQLVKPNSYYILDDDDINETNDYCILDNQPIQYVDSYITSLTGITNKMLENAQTEEQVLPAFKEFIRDEIIIGHNVNFDINFIYDSFMENLNEPLKNNFIDTMRIARRLLKQLSHHRLKDLAEHYQIDCKKAHRALEDCYITNEILVALKNDVERQYDNISEFLHSANTRLITKNITTEKTEFDQNHPLYGRVCVFTGILERMQRKDAMQIVADLGGINGNSVTAKTNYLILGNNDYCPLIKGGKSNKQKKAEELKLKGKDIEIITENVFYDMIEQE